MKTKSTKTVRQLVEQIISENSGIYYTDDGQGCGGPGYLTPDDLRVMCRDDSIDDYEILDAADVPCDLIADTLSAFNHPSADPTTWIVARFIFRNGGSSNPYTHYMLVWDND